MTSQGNFAPFLGLHPYGPKSTKQQHLQALQSNSRRPFDPEDLYQRLLGVVAEREAAEVRQRIRSIAAEYPRHLPDLPESDEEYEESATTTENSSEPSTETESLEQPSGFGSSRARKTQFGNFTWKQPDRSKKNQSGVPELKIDTACPLQTEPGFVKSPALVPPPPTASSRASGAEAPPASAVPPSRRASINVASLKSAPTTTKITGPSASRRVSHDARYIPQQRHSPAQFGSTAAPPNSVMVDDRIVPRQRPRRGSMQFFGESDASMASPTTQKRRSPIRASQGLWDGIQEPTIFESSAAAAEAKKLHRRTMIEAPSKPMSSQETGMSARRMSTGDMGEARDKSSGNGPRAGASAKAASGDPSVPDIWRDHHQVDWTQQGDEDDGKKRRSSRLLRRFGLGRRSSHDSSGASFEEGSDDTNEGSRAASRQTLEVPESPRSPRIKSLWPFRRLSTHLKEHH